MQKIIRQRILRQKQKNYYKPSYQTFFTIFNVKLSPFYSRRTGLKIAKTAKFNKKLLFRYEWLKNLYRYHEVKLLNKNFGLIFTVLRKPFFNKRHIVLHRLLFQKKNWNFGKIRRGKALSYLTFLKYHTDTQSHLQTIAWRKLRANIKKGILRLPKLKNKKYTQKKKTSKKKTSNFKKNKEKEFYQWLQNNFGNESKRFVSGKHWRNKKKNKIKKRFFWLNRKKQQIHHHLLDPQKWRSYRIATVGVPFYLAEITKSNNLWKNNQWISPQNFNNQFLKNYKKAVIKQIKMQRWYDLRPFYEFSKLQYQVKASQKLAYFGINTLPVIFPKERFFWKYWLANFQTELELTKEIQKDIKKLRFWLKNFKNKVKNFKEKISKNKNFFKIKNNSFFKQLIKTITKTRIIKTSIVNLVGLKKKFIFEKDFPQAIKKLQCQLQFFEWKPEKLSKIKKEFENNFINSFEHFADEKNFWKSANKFLSQSKLHINVTNNFFESKKSNWNKQKGFKKHVEKYKNIYHLTKIQNKLFVQKKRRKELQQQIRNQNQRWLHSFKFIANFSKIHKNKRFDKQQNQIINNNTNRHKQKIKSNSSSYAYNNKKNISQQEFSKNKTKWEKWKLFQEQQYKTTDFQKKKKTWDTKIYKYQLNSNLKLRPLIKERFKTFFKNYYFFAKKNSFNNYSFSKCKKNKKIYTDSWIDNLLSQWNLKLSKKNLKIINKVMPIQAWQKLPEQIILNVSSLAKIKKKKKIIFSNIKIKKKKKYEENLIRWAFKKLVRTKQINNFNKNFKINKEILESNWPIRKIRKIRRNIVKLHYNWIKNYIFKKKKIEKILYQKYKKNYIFKKKKISIFDVIKKNKKKSINIKLQKKFSFWVKKKLTKSRNIKLNSSSALAYSSQIKQVQHFKQRFKNNNLFLTFKEKLLKQNYSKKNWKFSNEIKKGWPLRKSLRIRALGEKLLANYIHTETDLDFKEGWPIIQQKQFCWKIFTIQEISPKNAPNIKENKQIWEKWRNELKLSNEIINKKKEDSFPENFQNWDEIRKEWEIKNKTAEGYQLNETSSWNPSVQYPRYITKLTNCIIRPMRQRSGPGGRGNRAFARLYRRRFLTQLLSAVIDKQKKLWRQLVPFGFNSPLSYRWRRLNRRSYVWDRFQRRHLRWGPRNQILVQTRLRKGRIIKKRYLNRLYRTYNNRSKTRNERSKKIRRRPWSDDKLSSMEWRLRLIQLSKLVNQRRRTARAISWLNRQMTKSWQDANVNVRSGEIQHILRIRKFVLRKKKVRSYHRGKRFARQLRKRFFRFTKSYFNYFYKNSITLLL